MDILLIDHYDSFSQNLLDWVSYPTEIYSDFSVKVMQFDDPDLFKVVSNSMCPIVLSPGPHSPQSAPETVELISKYAFKRPILGVCFGHQCIAECFGVGLRKRLAPNHGSVVPLNIINESKISQFVSFSEPIEVMSYNSLEIKRVPNGFYAILEDQQNNPWAIANESHDLCPIYGLQFHPESFMTNIYSSLMKGWHKVCVDFIENIAK